MQCDLTPTTRMLFVKSPGVLIIHADSWDPPQAFLLKILTWSREQQHSSTLWVSRDHGLRIESSVLR